MRTTRDNKESALKTPLPSSASATVDSNPTLQMENNLGDDTRTIQPQPLTDEFPPSHNAAVRAPSQDADSQHIPGHKDDNKDDKSKGGLLVLSEGSTTSNGMGGQGEAQGSINEENEVDLVNALANALLNQYESDAIVELQSYKIEQNKKQPSIQEQSQPQPQLQHSPISDEEKTSDQQKTLQTVVNLDSVKNDLPILPEVRKNKLNRNYALLEEEEDEEQSPFNVDTGSRGDRSRNRVVASGHHHHITSSSSSSQDDKDVEDDAEVDSNIELLEDTKDDQNQQQASSKTLQSQSSIILAEQESKSGTTVPDSIKNRGLIPEVLGAHHCTPQFCVNVTVSDDGQFATFHIERPMAATGWISLGIGYAMTMADLIIMWPTATSQDEKVILERGAVLSRRTSHAYVEPTVVGHESTNPLGDRISEASLYPPNEYILHNANSGPNALATTKGGSKPFSDPKVFVVQFTRPIRTKNLAHKLTPGTEQDFCWAYSPRPVSPDSILDPAAHITQHMSVGSFAMDVAANQPHLKEVLLKQKEQDVKEEAMEKERKQKALEIENAKLAAEEEERLKNGEGGGDINGDSKTGSSKHSDGVTGESLARPSSASETKWWWAGGRGSAMQGFTGLIPLALIYFFR
ncbi:hypothetical protein EMPS_06350 [Entomortierella parvispora]|uniref:DOMON domain-containing protein n=1 Tax=Entomortierella parvispora TaxID=205924 RepID=A0A9P3HCA1_9FUNG|nr:hypothetical protein EMPS_06350 [Entomortierella parvispora]